MKFHWTYLIVYTIQMDWIQVPTTWQLSSHNNQNRTKKGNITNVNTESLTYDWRLYIRKVKYHYLNMRWCFLYVPYTFLIHSQFFYFEHRSTFFIFCMVLWWIERVFLSCCLFVCGVAFVLCLRCTSLSRIFRSNKAGFKY